MEGAFEMDGMGCEGTPSDRRNQRRVLGWSLGWMVGWVVAGLALRFDWVADAWVAVGVVALTVGFGAGVFRAYYRFLHETDELRRKIELDALALATGVAVLGGLSWHLLSRTGAIPEPGVPDLVILMTVVYVAGVLVGRRRYR